MSLVVLLSLVAWVGTDVIAQRFADGTEATMRGRLDAWTDAVRIGRDFPIVGSGVNTFRTAMLTYQTAGRADYWSEAHND